MTNKLGIVTTAILSDKKMISKDGEYICAVPEDRQDVREGLIAYLDRTGMLQFMEEDPHDYR